MGVIFSAVLGFLLDFFARYLSAKVVITAAAVGTFLAITGIVFAAFYEAAVAIKLVLPSQFLWALGVIPSNTPLCISAVLNVRIVLLLFAIKNQILDISAKAK